MHFLHFKNSPKVLWIGGLQGKVFRLSCTCIKRRKCGLLIQPINATTPRIGFKGTKNSYGLRAKGYTDSGAAMINAGGLSIAAGGITAAVARVYTQSWSQAGMLGLFGAFLTLFFMTPQLIDRFGIK